MPEKVILQSLRGEKQLHSVRSDRLFPIPSPRSSYAIASLYACDETVIRSGTDAKRYASLLCDFAEERANTPFALAMADASSLEKRVGRMFKPTGRTGTLAFVAMGLLGAASACALSMMGSAPNPVDELEVQLRLSADPFPGER